VIQNENLDDILSQYIPGSFTQWVADNVDHNISTLDGKGTFHGMGIIAVSTPKDNNLRTTHIQTIHRQERINVSDLITNKGIPIFQYTSSVDNPLQSITYKPINHLQFPYTLPKEICSNLLWNFG
jgi:hypothetical protein